MECVLVTRDLELYANKLSFEQPAKSAVHSEGCRAP